MPGGEVQLNMEQIGLIQSWGRQEPDDREDELITRGKRAAIPPRVQAFAMDPDKLVLIDDPTHPLYDSRIHLPIDEAMVANIMYRGVLEPIIVRKNGPHVEVVDGRQRVKNTREANRRLEAQGKLRIAIPCVVKRGTNRDLFGILVAANAHRHNDEPLARAEKAQRMLDMGMTIDEIGIDLGVSVQTVRNLLQLLECSPEVQETMREGKVTAGVARHLARLDQAAQKTELDKLLASGKKLTTREILAEQTGRKQATPNRRRIERLAKALPSGGPALVLRWLLGELDDAELARQLPEMGEAFEKVNAERKGKR